MIKIFNLSFFFFLILSVTSYTHAQDTSFLYKTTPTRDLAINVYYPENQKPDQPKPGIVFFFGGGWVGGNPAHFHNQCDYLSQRGIIAMAADYRIKSKDNTSPIASMMDAKSAIRWIRKHAAMLGIDPEQLIASGGSAGGHLAAVTAIIKDFNDPEDDLAISPVPNALILFNPVIDVSKKGYGSEKLGADSVKASPVHHVTNNLPPTIIFHGTNDKVVPFENIIRFDSLMKINGNACEVVPFHRKGHGFFNPGRNKNVDYLETLYLTDKFLERHGYLDGEPTVFTNNLDNNIFASPLMAGEPTESSILLQARLVSNPNLTNRDVKGKHGYGYFEISDNPAFYDSRKSEILMSTPENDFIIKKEFTGLNPGSIYYYRVFYGKSKNTFLPGNVGTFKTLQGLSSSDSISFVMVTGSHYQRFYWNWGTQKSDRDAKPSDMVLNLGFPGHKAVRALKSDFYIGNGDNVYYDHVKGKTGRADSLYEMRECWHRQFSHPRFQQLLSETPVYWMKDDHDYRFDDADTTASERFGDLPSHELGVQTFLEQVPVVHPTYRTYRINKNLQIWMLEGRDYRSPNTQRDNKNKSIWGIDQKTWLKKTLLASDADFKLVISPTPMIGPDDKRKTDNHTNIGGFRIERDAFFQWITDNELLEKGFYLLCGDRHWQYHSIHPSGIEEFSCGALVDNNSRLGRLPGDPKSTDPEGKIKQPYTQLEASGGFLQVVVHNTTNQPELILRFFDEHGNKLHELTRH